MSYKTLIDRKLALAFKLLKDLAEEITLVKKSNVSFDFENAETITTEDASLKTKLINVTSDKSKTNRTERLIMLKRREIGDLTTYDHLLWENEKWTIGSPINDDGFISLIKIHKEL